MIARQVITFHVIFILTLLNLHLYSVTSPIEVHLLLSSNAALFSFSQLVRKRDCDSLNKAVTASPVIFTFAPKPLAPNALSAKATAKPPSANHEQMNKSS